MVLVREAKKWQPIIGCSGCSETVVGFRSSSESLRALVVEKYLHLSLLLDSKALASNVALCIECFKATVSQLKLPQEFCGVCTIFKSVRTYVLLSPPINMLVTGAQLVRLPSE